MFAFLSQDNTRWPKTNGKDRLESNQRKRGHIQHRFRNKLFLTFKIKNVHIYIFYVTNQLNQTRISPDILLYIPKLKWVSFRFESRSFVNHIPYYNWDISVNDNSNSESTSSSMCYVVCVTRCESRITPNEGCIGKSMNLESKVENTFKFLFSEQMIR